MRRVSCYGLLLVLVSLMTLGLGGCGGGGSAVQSPEVNEAAGNPYAGLYYFYSPGRTNLDNLIMGCLRIQADNSVRLCAIGADVSYPVPGSGTVTTAGAANLSFTCKRNNGQTVKFTFTGTFKGSGTSRSATGSWSRQGATGSWRAGLCNGVDNSGSWNYTLGGQARQFSYSRAFAIVFPADGDEYMIIMLDSPSTALPMEFALMIPQPRTLPLNSTRSSGGALLALGLAMNSWYYDSETIGKPTFSLSARSISAGGRVSGKLVSAKLKDYDSATKAIFTNRLFSQVKIVYVAPD